MVVPPHDAVAVTHPPTSFDRHAVDAHSENHTVVSMDVVHPFPSTVRMALSCRCMRTRACSSLVECAVEQSDTLRQLVDRDESKT